MFFTVCNMACDASFLKHYRTPVIHFGILHFKNKETLFYSAGPISRYSPITYHSVQFRCARAAYSRVGKDRARPTQMLIASE